MGGLRHLRPAQMRQLYQACVPPKLDYASTVWHNPFKDKTHFITLNSVQRTALIRILSAFRTVATQSLEVEAISHQPGYDLMRAQNVISNLFTLPEGRPIHSVIQWSQQAVQPRPRGLGLAWV
jgi:hypothetical protein